MSNLTLRRVRTVVEALTDAATADAVIVELRKTPPEPFDAGQVVVQTSTGRLFRWRNGMDSTGVRELNAGEIG